MKKLFLLGGLLVFACIARSQFMQDIRLTNDPGESVTSPNNARSIAASGSSLSVVWRDNRDGNREIYYKRSADGGATWSEDMRLTNDANPSMDPALAVDGSMVHVVWSDQKDGNEEIYYLRSTDGGMTWETAVRLTNNPMISNEPSVAVSGSLVYVVWHDWRDSNDEIYFKVSADGGTTWGEDVRLTSTTGASEYPCVAGSFTAVHVTWQEQPGTFQQIYYMGSTDGGTTWGPAMQLTNDLNEALSPCVAAYGNSVHLSWYDNRDGNNEIYYKRSGDGGSTWGQDIRLTNDANNSYRPSICTDGQFVHLTWVDNRDMNTEIYYKKTADDGNNWGPDQRLTEDGADSWRSSIAMSGPAVYVAWEDTRDGNYEIYFNQDPTGSVGIREKASDTGNDIVVYPNPAASHFFIRTEKPLQGPVTLLLHDLLGKTVSLKPDSEHAGSYNVSDLPDGIYTISATINQRLIGRCKLVIHQE